jgi:hypothetical protein
MGIQATICRAVFPLWNVMFATFSRHKSSITEDAHLYLYSFDYFVVQHELLDDMPKVIMVVWVMTVDIWEEAAVTFLRHHPDFSQDGLREVSRYLHQDSQSKTGIQSGGR